MKVELLAFFFFWEPFMSFELPNSVIYEVYQNSSKHIKGQYLFNQKLQSELENVSFNVWM